MNKPLIIKLKPEFEGYSKKLEAPDTFDQLMDIIKHFFKNDNPDKIFKITDKKTKNIIKDHNDYESLILENFTEKEITLIINIIDKPLELQEESNHICFKSNLILPKKIELTEEEKIKQSIRELVQSKIAILEQSIIDQISKQVNMNPQNVHKGIRCSNCGMENIVGTRYKCTICPNFNLCEICEENIDHDDDHALLKIKEPISSEEVLEKKINDSFVLIDLDFKAEPEIFEFKLSNMINIQTINLINTTNKIWNKKTSFICLKEKSNLIGNDIILDEEVEPGNYTKVEILYENMENINKNQKEYYSSFKLIDENKKQIGKIHTFKIHLI